MEELEKTIRYKIEVDDSAARLKMDQIATAGQLNLSSYAASASPGMYVTQSPAGPLSVQQPLPSVGMSTPINVGRIAAASTAMGVYEAGKSVYNFGMASVVDPIFGTPKYQDILLPNGRYALESTMAREVSVGLFGFGGASPTTNAWGFQKGKPEWMTQAEYENQMQESLYGRAEKFGWGTAKLGAQVGTFMSGIGLPAMFAVSAVIEKPIDAWQKRSEYRRKVSKFAQYSGVIGSRSGGLGFTAPGEDDRSAIASAVQSEDMTFWGEMLGRKPEFSMMDTMEMAAGSGIKLDADSPDQLIAKVKQTRDYLIKYAELLGTTKESVSKIAGVLSQAGITDTSEIDSMLGQVRNTKAYTGFSADKLLQQYGAGMNIASGMGYNPILGANMMAGNLQFYQSLKDQGDLRPWEKPEQKAAALTAGVLGLKETTIGRSLLMATINTDTGKVDKDILAQISSGKLSIADAMSARYEGKTGAGKYEQMLLLQDAAKRVDMTNPEDIRGFASAFQDVLKNNGMDEKLARTWTAREIQKMSPSTSIKEIYGYLDEGTYNRAQDRGAASAIINQLRKEGADITSTVYKGKAVTKEDTAGFVLRGGDLSSAMNANLINPDEFIDYKSLARTGKEIRESKVLDSHFEAAAKIINENIGAMGKMTTGEALERYNKMADDLAASFVKGGMARGEARTAAADALSAGMYQRDRYKFEALAKKATYALSNEHNLPLNPEDFISMFDKYSKGQAGEGVARTNKILGSMEEMTDGEKSDFAKYVLLRKKGSNDLFFSSLTDKEQGEYKKLSRSVGRKYGAVAGTTLVELMEALPGGDELKWNPATMGYMLGMKLARGWGSSSDDLSREGAKKISEAGSLEKDYGTDMAYSAASDVLSHYTKSGSSNIGMQQALLNKDEEAFKKAAAKGHMVGEYDFAAMSRQVEGVIAISEKGASTNVPEDMSRINGEKVNSLLDEVAQGLREVAEGLRQGRLHGR